MNEPGEEAFTALVLRYLDGEATPEEAALLKERLSSDPELRKRVVTLCRLHGQLAESVSAEFQRAALSVRAVTKRSWRHRVPHAKPVLLPAFAAAGFAAVIVLALALPKSSRPPAGRATAASEPVDAPDEEPAARPEPPKPIEARRPVEPLARPAPAEPERTAPNPPQPLPPEAPVPAPPPPKSTVAAAAKLDRVVGEVHVVSGGDKRPAAGGQDLLPGDGLEIGDKSLAVIVYADRTRVEAGAGTVLRLPGKQVEVSRGTVFAEVARRPKEQPMTFVTPHGEAVVLGTTLRLAVEKGSTRLDVIEGRVRLKRSVDGKAVDVESGHYAVAATGIELSSKPLPIDHILLLPKDGRWTGDWKRVEDAKASTGLALEPADGVTIADLQARVRAQRLASVEFSFSADARKDYQVWIRGCSLEPQAYDAVALFCPQAQFSVIDPDVAKITGVPLAVLSGFCAGQGYWWIGEAGKWPDGKPKLPVPITVRFAASGKQKMRLYALDNGIRIDALWLSATQKTRPDAKDHGPRK